MMLIRTNEPDGNSIVGALKSYVGKILAHDLEVAEYARTSSLPAFLGNIYEMHEARISGRRCILLVAGDDHGTPSQIAAHMDQVSDGDNAIPILVAPMIHSHMRDRLISHGIPFIVPGNQFYVPELGMDLRERLRSTRARNRDKLYPSAQAVLFHYLLRLDDGATTPKRLAEGLRCTNMTIGRAFDNLVAMNLAKTGRRGRERHIEFPSDRRELFNDAIPHLISPVRKERYIQGDRVSLARHAGREYLQLAGEGALAIRTNLSGPLVEAYAIAYEGWKIASNAQGFEETEDPRVAEFILETWHYDPESLSVRPEVDPLSLYAQFHGHGDPRVEAAAEQLLETIEW